MQTVDIAKEYPRHHYLGLDCRLTCLRNLLDYFGIRESYATTFGMSSSFNFVYRKDGFTYPESLEMPSCDFSQHFYPISGHRFDCMEKLAYTYSATLVGNYPDDAEGSLDRMRDFLRHGIPVMVAMSRHVLCEYTGRPTGFPEFMGPLEFGGHWVILVAVDDQHKTVILYETDLQQPITMSQEMFQAARSIGDDHQNCFMKSRNRWVVFIPPATTPPKSDMFHTALTKTAFHMRKQQDQGRVYLGLRGLRVLADELPSWHVSDEFHEDKFKATVWMMQLQGETLSSGGLGRRLFASYLHQAARICQSDSLQAASDSCSVAAETWRLLIARTAQRVLGEGWTDLRPDPEFAPLVQTIVDSETSVVGKIEEFLCQG